MTNMHKICTGGVYVYTGGRAGYPSPYRKKQKRPPATLLEAKRWSDMEVKRW